MIKHSCIDFDRDFFPSSKRGQKEHNMVIIILMLEPDHLGLNACWLCELGHLTELPGASVSASVKWG